MKWRRFWRRICRMQGARTGEMERNGEINRRVCPGEDGGQSRLALFVDHTETYGPAVVRRLLEQALPYRRVLDIGAGMGRDLEIARSLATAAETYAIDFNPADDLQRVADRIDIIDIE